MSSANARRLILRNTDIRDRAASLVAGLPVDAEKPLEVIVRPYRKNRSLAQNSLYWYWIDALRMHILDSTGRMFSKDDIHEWLAGEFLPTKVVELGGRKHVVRTSTSSLGVSEMRDYLEAIDNWAGSALGCFLPRHVDLWEEAMMERSK